MRMCIGCLIVALIALLVATGCDNTQPIDYYHAPTNATPVAAASNQPFTLKPVGAGVSVKVTRDLALARMAVPGQVICWPNQPTELVVDQGQESTQYSTKNLAAIGALVLGRMFIIQQTETIQRAHDAGYRYYNASIELVEINLGQQDAYWERFNIKDPAGHTMSWAQSSYQSVSYAHQSCS